LQRRAAAWRMANVDDLRNLCYDSGTITRGRHARRLRYIIMSARMDLIYFTIILLNVLSTLIPIATPTLTNMYYIAVSRKHLTA